MTDTAGIYVELAAANEHECLHAPISLWRDPDLDWVAKGAFGWINLQAGMRVSAAALAVAGPVTLSQAEQIITDLECAGWLTRESHAAPDGLGTVTIWTPYPEKLPESERTSPGSLS